MLQESVYSKLALNEAAVNAIKENVKKNKPDEGLVQLLTITEKQYTKMDIIVGDVKKEILDSTDRLVIIWNSLIQIYLDIFWTILTLVLNGSLSLKICKGINLSNK